MKILLTAAGTPAEIHAALTRDVARERAAHPECAGSLHGARDDISKLTGAAVPLEGDAAPKHYTVSASIEINVTEQKDAATAERARLPLIGGAAPESEESE